MTMMIMITMMKRMKMMIIQFFIYMRPDSTT